MGHNTNTQPEMTAFMRSRNGSQTPNGEIYSATRSIHHYNSYCTRSGIGFAYASDRNCEKQSDATDQYC